MNRCLSSASFQVPEFIEPSAWVEHAPFAFWLVQAQRPRSFVELGTHSGYSYFAFCQAVRALGLATRCYAVDTWKGDEHAGFYGEEVFERVRDYNEARYASFSRLVRSTFDDALVHFSDGAIDLLHIDGCHFYEDVRHDFESWRPKLSERAVVVFHDTNVRERKFGVFRLWEELRAEFPNFEILHGHGLGVLGYGSSLPEEVRALFDAASDPDITTEVRTAYARLGGALKTELVLREARSQAAAKLREQETRAAKLDTELEARSQAAAKLREEETRATKLETELAARSKELGQRADEGRALRQRVAALEAQISAIYASRSWRLAAPVRAFGRNLRQLRGAGGLARAIGRSVLTKSPKAGYGLLKGYHLLLSSGAFDPDYYRRRYPDVAAMRADPALHYLLHGMGEGRNPNALFDTDWYLRQNPDVAATGLNPLVHYLRFGACEGRAPSPRFFGSAYLAANPDVAKAGANPLAHYLRFGQKEGRPLRVRGRQERAPGTRNLVNGEVQNEKLDAHRDYSPEMRSN